MASGGESGTAVARDSKVEGKKGGPTRTSRMTAGVLALSVVLGVVLGFGVAYLILVVGLDVDLSVWATFAVTMAIGTAGALVYLVVLFVTDDNLTALARLWENKRLRREYAIPLFLISGGLVASLAQVSSGAFSVGDVWATFLLGFGWLGAMSGVGGSSSARTEAETLSKKDEKIDRQSDKLNSQEKELTEKTAKFKEREDEIQQGIADYTGLLQRRADRELERKFKEIEEFYARLQSTGST